MPFRSLDSSEPEAYPGFVSAPWAEPQWCVCSGGHSSLWRGSLFEDGWELEGLGTPRTSEPGGTWNASRSCRGTGCGRGLHSAGCLHPDFYVASMCWRAFLRRPRPGRSSEAYLWRKEPGADAKAQAASGWPGTAAAGRGGSVETATRSRT